MKKPLVCLGLVFVLACEVIQAALPESAKIDEILARSWQKQHLKPNPPASDEVFVRRIYLDIAGRIPTAGEAAAFLKSGDPDKRAKLIDALLASDGYVSNFFNYFADILRLQTDTKGQLTGYAYADWLKAALKKNQPYDSMVRELLTTDGAAWENGAIGFYMRDQGMPLDHLAATVQVFLGTRIECAQCHNHPFDKWTQMDYYKMAAFTYGMDTRKSYNLDLKNMGGGMDRRKLKGPEAAEMRKDFQLIRESVGEVAKSLRYTQIKETDRLPRLPHDYKYPDAKPGDTIEARTMFGHEAAPAGGETRLDAFAKWMTDRDNPRFTTVIANRLWKKVMGMGLIEPVDEMMDSTVPSNAELMTYLEELMIARRYDLKSFLRVLFNSDVYQRMPSTKDVMLGDSYAFTGPLMRRMSAEQIWDSVATLVQGDIDAQGASQNEAAERRLDVLGRLYETLSQQNPQDIIARVKAMNGAASNPEKDAKIKELTAQMQEARRKGDKEAANKLSQQIKKLRSGDRTDAFAAVLGEDAAREFLSGMKDGNYKKKADQKKFVPASLDRDAIRKLQASGADKKEIRKKIEEMKRAAQSGGKSAGMIAGATRASDMPSPAPRGHMLRIFGQSDRETIENASRESAVPQALSMLNGPVADAVINPNSAFGGELAKADGGGDPIGTIYLGLLSRHPTNDERRVLNQVVAERGHSARADIVHALLNTGEFLFVK